MITNENMALLKIRLAELSEINSLNQICEKAYSDTYAFHWETPEFLGKYVKKEFSVERLLKDVSDPKIRYFFIFQNETPIGFIKLQFEPNYQDFERDKTVEIVKFYIVPEQINKGFGSEVFKQVLEFIKINKQENIVLNVLDSNIGAIHFYKKLGFEYHSDTKVTEIGFLEKFRGMQLMTKKI